MTLSHLYLSLGSNSGERHRNIGCATSLLDTFFSRMDATLRVSSPLISRPMGFESPNSFVNVGAVVSFDPPVEADEDFFLNVLSEIQKIEKRISLMPHRNPDGSYRDREIDIDLIAADGFTMESPRLTIPHPRMHLRPFVLTPMETLLPTWCHPLLGKTPSQLLKDLETE